MNMKIFRNSTKRGWLFIFLFAAAGLWLLPWISYGEIAFRYKGHMTGDHICVCDNYNCSADTVRIRVHIKLGPGFNPSDPSYYALSFRVKRDKAGDSFGTLNELVEFTVHQGEIIDGSLNPIYEKELSPLNSPASPPGP